MQTDILIIGAGACGLLAAKTLAEDGKTVRVLEARETFGGRARTLHDNRFAVPAETGAEFIHGRLPLTLQLLQRAGIDTLPTGGEMWRHAHGSLKKEDDFIEDGAALEEALRQEHEEMAMSAFLKKHFNTPRFADLKASLKRYVEGYYAGDVQRASLQAFKEEWLHKEEPQFRVAGGYNTLLQYLHNGAAAAGAIFHFLETATGVAWAAQRVTVTTRTGSIYSAKKLLVTVPPAVLLQRQQLAFIRFQPALAAQNQALQQLGFGSVIKILVQFKNPFWETDFDLHKMGFLFSAEPFPTWWTQLPKRTAYLVGWCAGPQADSLKHLADDELFRKAMQSLAAVFSTPAALLHHRVAAFKVCNWAADAYTLGGYSYTTIQSKTAIESLSQPVNDTIYFAGEALYDSINVGTVEAALQTGLRAAQQILKPGMGN